MQEKPLITYPTPYPIKIIGISSDNYKTDLLQVIEQHDPDYQRHSVKLKPSRNGKFVSLHVVIIAQSEQHIMTLTKAIKNNPLVKMIL